MIVSRNRLYALLIGACLVGYLWLFLNLTNESEFLSKEVNVCLFKKVTSIPCPSCGSTRSVLSLLHGKIEQAFLFNPIGFLLFLIMMVSPIWICIDYLLKKDSFYHFYKQAERIIKQKAVAVPLIGLVLLNWIWNIYKDI
ncbi:hypothetical protein BZG02_08145 [Labilibaculum filiforme]|uniref:DUF2752 domain-containing protein n=1 Tax=Labilibaculum filiforme TaxID=1940526 RepID=A0A2N3I145_9BACT|nr:hypothetical protein BZG02_08145 [Labilibaculum filiforme]